MKEIRSTRKYKDSDDYFNEITTMLDSHLIEHWSGLTDKFGFSTYMMFRRKDGAAIRFPGATRGSVNFDKDKIITEVMLYTDMGTIYDDTALDDLKKYIGCKLIIPERVELVEETD